MNRLELICYDSDGESPPMYGDSGIIEEYSAIADSQCLNYSNVQFDYKKIIPDTFKGRLDLSRSNLSQLPDYFSQLQITELILDGNDFSQGIPQCIGKMENLRYLSMKNARIWSIAVKGWTHFPQIADFSNNPCMTLGYESWAKTPCACIIRKTPMERYLNRNEHPKNNVTYMGW